MRTLALCELCEQPIAARYPITKARAQRRFCSRRCATRAVIQQKYQERLARYQSAPKLCKNCKTPLRVPKFLAHLKRRLYCSQRCAGIANATGVPRHRPIDFAELQEFYDSGNSLRECAV